MKNKKWMKGTAQKLRIRAGGQVVLMVLLVSALVLTLGLSASKVTTTETKIESDQEILKKAFNVAESAIDYYMATGNTGVDAYKSSDNSQTADLSVTNIGGAKTLSFGRMTQLGDIEYFWLVNHTDDGKIGTSYFSKISGVDDNIKICGSYGTYKMKVDYFYIDNSGNYRVYRAIKTDSTDTDKCFNFDINPGSTRSLLLTVMPLNKSNIITIQSDKNFPFQGKKVSAIGKIGGVNNKVTVSLDTYGVDPILTEGVISGGGILSGGDGTEE